MNAVKRLVVVKHRSSHDPSPHAVDHGKGLDKPDEETKEAHGKPTAEPTVEAAPDVKVKDEIKVEPQVTGGDKDEPKGTGKEEAPGEEDKSSSDNDNFYNEIFYDAAEGDTFLPSKPNESEEASSCHNCV